MIPFARIDAANSSSRSARKTVRGCTGFGVIASIERDKPLNDTWGRHSSPMEVVEVEEDSKDPYRAVCVFFRFLCSFSSISLASLM